MDRYLILLLFIGLIFCQDLVFYNNQDTIQFKEGDLININGIKYKYLGANQNETQINILKKSLFNLPGTIQTLDINKIKSFGKYKRFSIKNSFEKSAYGFCITTGITTIGFNIFMRYFAYGGGLDTEDNPLGSAAILYGSLYAGTIYGTIFGAPAGFVYGLVALDEDKAYEKHQYKIKFN